jgi:hypothetical protein
VVSPMQSVQSYKRRAVSRGQSVPSDMEARSPESVKVAASKGASKAVSKRKTQADSSHRRREVD